VGAAARASALAAAGSGGDRVIAGNRRLRPRAGEEGAARRARARLIEPETAAAPSLRRGDRPPARLDAHGRQPERRRAADPLLDAVPDVRGSVAAPAAPEWLTAGRGYDHDKYRRLLRERGIRPRDRPAPERARFRARPLPLSDRARLRLAAQLQAPARPLRAPRRHPPGAPRPSPQSRLLPQLRSSTEMTSYWPCS
jgi:hypothetical protein